MEINHTVREKKPVSATHSSTNTGNVQTGAVRGCTKNGPMVMALEFLRHRQHPTSREVLFLPVLSERQSSDDPCTVRQRPHSRDRLPTIHPAPDISASGVVLQNFHPSCMTQHAST